MWCIAFSICSPERVEEYLQTSSWATEPSGQLKSKNTLEGFLLSGSLTEAYLNSLSGMMSEPFRTKIPIHEATLIGSVKGATPWLSQRDFLAQILASPENVQALARKQEAVSTVKSCDALASFDRVTCSWKTLRRLSQPQTSSLLPFLKSVSSSIFLARRIRSRSQGDTFVASSKLDYKQLSEQFLGTWPRSGMTRNGCVYELPIVGRRTGGTGGGASAFKAGLVIKPSHSVPTPTASDHIERRSTSKEKLNPLTNKSVSLDRWVQFWPTPCAVDVGSRFNKSASDGAALRPTLGAMAKFNMWPTPTSTLGTKGGRVTPRKSREGGTLIEAVSARAFPTPSSNDWKGSSKPGQRRGQLTDPGMDAIPAGGKLNPVWVAWLMCWPLGHLKISGGK